MQQGFIPVPQQEEIEVYRYSPVHMDIDGPPLPSEGDNERLV